MRTLKADLHLHSKYSWDSSVPIERYIAKAEEIGYGAISITDHNNAQSHEVIKSLQENTKVVLVPGQEVSTKDGHLLIYGWVELIEHGLPMHDTVVKAKTLAGSESVICIAAHPFDKLRGGRGKRVLNTGIDGIEILNASTLLNYYNKKAAKYVENAKIIKMGNSDAHRIEEFGTAWNELPEANNVDEVLEALKESKPYGRIIGIKKKTIRFSRRKLRLMKE